jgi:hypothetical protein
VGGPHIPACTVELPWEVGSILLPCILASKVLAGSNRMEPTQNNIPCLLCSMGKLEVGAETLLKKVTIIRRKMGKRLLKGIVIKEKKSCCQMTKILIHSLLLKRVFMMQGILKTLPMIHRRKLKRWRELNLTRFKGYKWNHCMP